MKTQTISLATFLQMHKKGTATTIEEPAIELPFCNAVAVGKEVVLKANIPGPVWPVLARGRWTEYGRFRQVISGGFDFVWELAGNVLRYHLRAQHGENTIDQGGEFAVERSYRCDECADGRRNNQSRLTAAIPTGGSFETWPKNRDRKRIVVVSDRRYEIEIDTTE